MITPEKQEDRLLSHTQDYAQDYQDALSKVQDKKYMAIAMSANIPVSAIEAILTKLKPGGLLLKECPSIESLKEMQSTFPDQNDHVLILGPGQAIIDAYAASILYLHCMYKLPVER